VFIWVHGLRPCKLQINNKDRNIYFSSSFYYGHFVVTLTNDLALYVVILSEINKHNEVRTKKYK
jgi:hypothetical protein